jgi:dihydrofolate reductase
MLLSFAQERDKGFSGRGRVGLSGDRTRSSSRHSAKEGEEHAETEPGQDMAILGSGSIVSQLAQHGLIDEYQIVVVPVALGKGRTLFEGVKEKVPLKLTKTRTFRNGNVLLCYEPAPFSVEPPVQ